MVGSLLAALLIFGQTPSIGKYEVGERAKGLDQAWLATQDHARRSAALPKITSAISAYMSNRFSDACQMFDEATATLEGRAPSSEDAVCLRFEPPFAEPRAAAKLLITWAYVPKSATPVRLTVGQKSVVSAPGRTLTIEVHPEQLNPDILQNPEVGYLMPVQVGAEQRDVYLSIIKHPRERLAALQNTKVPEARTLVEFLDKAFTKPDDLPGDYPLIQYLFTAELLDEGRMKIERADSLPLAKAGNTYFRAVFPKTTGKGINLVIALHGAGGTENMFFDSYGSGVAVKEALKRGWGFVAPRSSATAVQDVLDWVRTRRKQHVDHVFVIGHSMGAGFALQAAEVKPRPTAIAAFAPALQSLPSNLGETPVFFAVGKQDLLDGIARDLYSQVSNRKNSEFLELDPCEHLMVVADAVPAAFRFFDARVAK